MRYFILILMCMACTMPAGAKHLHTEREYQAYWCNAHDGKMEVVMKNGSRADCITDKYAVEVDFASKYHQCHGQAMEYSAQTGKHALCLLIVESDKDLKYVKRLRATRDKKKIPMYVRTIKPDVFNSRF